MPFLSMYYVVSGVQNGVAHFYNSIYIILLQTWMIRIILITHYFPELRYDNMYDKDFYPTTDTKINGLHGLVLEVHCYGVNYLILR